VIVAVIVFAPTFSAHAFEPHTPDAPVTVTTAPLSLFVGVIVTLDTAFATAAVYDVVVLTNAGVSVPALSASPLRFALLDAARVTTIT
jgi:hypothetical protein